MVLKVNIHEAKTRLSELIRVVESEGEEVRICRNGKPVAQLTRLAEIHDPLVQHSELSKVLFANGHGTVDEIANDSPFEQPLSSEQ